MADHAKMQAAIRQRAAQEKGVRQRMVNDHRAHSSDNITHPSPPTQMPAKSQSVPHIHSAPKPTPVVSRSQPIRSAPTHTTTTRTVVRQPVHAAPHTTKTVVRQVPAQNSHTTKHGPVTVTITRKPGTTVTRTVVKRKKF